MPKSSYKKVDFKENFSSHLNTLKNAVIQNNFENHTTENPYLDSLFETMDCMSDKTLIRTIANEGAVRVKTELREACKEVGKYLKVCSESERHFIRSTDIRSESRFNSDDDGKKYQFYFIINLLIFLSDAETESTTVVGDNRSSTSRRVRRRIEVPNLNIAIESDDTWLYSDACVDDLITKYEFRVKALVVEKKRRQMLAEKIVYDAVNVYCSKSITNSLYDSQEY
jgi:hypothetical protein